MDNFLIAKATDVGKTREINEDSMAVFDSPNGQVLVVCDGMGGQAAGDVASKLAVTIIESILTDNTFSSPEEAIKSSIMAANRGVLNKTVQDPKLEGMGATCVMLIIKDGLAYCGWVGDSRIYYITGNSIRQISHDQSYVQQLVDAGQISEEEAASHPQKNEITNCIGLPEMTAPQTLEEPIKPEPGGIFLLCTDGLSGMVSDQMMTKVASDSSMSLQQRANRLVQLANDAGGLDNITVELVQFGTSEVVGATSGTLFMTPEGMKNERRKKTPMFMYIVGALLVIAAGLFIGRYYYTTHYQVELDKVEIKNQQKKPVKKTQAKDPVKKQPAPIQTQQIQPTPSPEEEPSRPISNKGRQNDIQTVVKGKNNPQSKIEEIKETTPSTPEVLNKMSKEEEEEKYGR